MAETGAWKPPPDAEAGASRNLIFLAPARAEEAALDPGGGPA